MAEKKLSFLRRLFGFKKRSTNETKIKRNNDGIPASAVEYECQTTCSPDKVKSLIAMKPVEVINDPSIRHYLMSKSESKNECDGLIELNGPTEISQKLHRASNVT